MLVLKRAVLRTANGITKITYRFTRMMLKNAGSSMVISSKSAAELVMAVMRADVTERIQTGVVYTTFHFPESGANVITTDNSDWATTGVLNTK